jgi:hypothetical protein
MRPYIWPCTPADGRLEAVNETLDVHADDRLDRLGRYFPDWKRILTTTRVVNPDVDCSQPGGCLFRQGDVADPRKEGAGWRL